MDFDSLNVYQSLQAITANSPDELVDILKSITTPIKVLGFVQVGARSVAYVTGDIRLVPKPKSKKSGVNSDGNPGKAPNLR